MEKISPPKKILSSGRNIVSFFNMVHPHDSRVRVYTVYTVWIYYMCVCIFVAICEINCHCWSGVATGASIVDICDTHKRKNMAQNSCLMPPQCKLQGIKIETFHSSRQNLLHNKFIKQTTHLAIINVLVARLMVENELQHDLYTISC